MQALAPSQGGGSREPSPEAIAELHSALQDLTEILDTEGRIKAAAEAIGKIPGGANILKFARTERDCRRVHDILDRRGTHDPSPDDLQAAREALAGSAETAAERRDWADELEALLARLTAEREQLPALLNRPPATGTYTQPLDHVKMFPAVFDARPINECTRCADVKDTRSPSKSGDKLVVELDYRGLLYTFPGIAFGPYCQRVYSACASLYQKPDPETGIPYDNCFTLTEIWRKMGNVGKPKPTRKQLDNVYDALDAMRRILITIYDRVGLLSNESLLTLAFTSSRIRGGFTADAVDICRPPPLASYFEEIRQYTQIPDDVMAVRGLYQNDGNIQLQDYINRRIGAVGGKKSNRDTYKLIKWETLRRECPLADWNRGPEKGAYNALYLILEHYSDCDHIAGYDWTKRGIEIRLKKG